MPLRILLADESTTIKKAFQIALSDLGAEIKSVPSGLDVLSVSLDFKPTIIFADVLLTKKSGYEVCRDITGYHQTKNIPVVLMWSSFMEFNTTLANQVGYTDKLEKPFDSAALRKVITRFYKETETHPLKGMLDFPALPEFSEEFTPIQLKPMTESAVVENPVQAAFANENKNNNSIYIETESHGDFEEVILVQSNAKRSDDQFKVSQHVRSYLENSPAALNQIDKISKTVSANTNFNTNTQSQNTRLNESLIREEVRVMAEKLCWQMIPDIAEKIIKAELEKLMKNIETSI
jgi:two-component system, cell cycle response regulator